MNDNIRLFKPYLRGIPLIIFTMVVSYLIAKKVLNYFTPMYESTAKLRLADISEGVTSSNLFKDFDVFATSNRIAAEIEVIKSEVLLNKVFDELNYEVEIFRKGKIKTVEIYTNSPIIIEYSAIEYEMYDKLFDLEIIDENNYKLIDPETNQFFHGVFNEPLQLPHVNLVISLNDSFLDLHPNIDLVDNYEFQIISRQKLINTTQKNLDISSVDKDVPIIRINYQSPNPEKAALLANKLTEVYINDYIESKNKVANITVDFLLGRIDEVLYKLTHSEEEIQDFRDLKGITNIRQETETDLRQLAQLEIQHSNLEMELEAIRELEAYIKEGADNFLELAPNFEAFTYLLSTEMIKSLKSLQAEKRDLLLIYTPNDEKVKVTEDKIKDITSYLIEGVGNTRKNRETKFKNLNNEILAKRKLFIGIPNKEKILNILNREFELYQQSYTFLNEKKVEAEIAQAAKIAFHRIITYAQIPKKPISPNRLIIQLVTVLLGMIVALIFIYTIHALKAKVNDTYTIESNSLIPLIVRTPFLRNKKEKKNHFLKLANQLEINDFTKNGNVVCFSSFDQNEGALFNVFHLAKSISSQGRKCLLIDVDNSLNISQLGQNTAISYRENMDVINLCNLTYNSYTKAKMQEYVVSLKNSYDIILILNEPLETHKSILMMAVADINIVVLDSRLSSFKRIIATDLLKEKYGFSTIYFGLNRVGYNPNLIKEIYKCTKRSFHFRYKK